MIFKHRFRKAWILGAAITLGGHAVLAQTGTFTKNQVTAGHKNFFVYCASCHGDDLAGGGEVPGLTGPIFNQDWSSSSLGGFYAYIYNAMPQGLEGDLKPEEYSSITAYVLAANGAKPGQAPFTGKSDVKISAIANGKIVSSVVNAPVQ